MAFFVRLVVPGGAGGAMATPDFGRSVNPISTKGGRLFPPNNTGTPGISDLPTALRYYVLAIMLLSNLPCNLSCFCQHFLNLQASARNKPVNLCVFVSFR